MYVKMVIDEWRLNMVTGRYFDRSRLESEYAREGLTTLQEYLQLAVENDFFPMALDLDYAAGELGVPVNEMKSRFQALIKEGWRSSFELEQVCVYAVYPMAEGILPSIDRMLAAMLTATLIDAAELAAEDSETEFLQVWIRRKIEPLQVAKMNDFHVAMFIVDYLADSLRGMDTTFKRYRNTYGGARITPRMLGEFFEKCAWFPETQHVTFRTPEPEMSASQILYQLQAELHLDYKRERLASGEE